MPVTDQPIVDNVHRYHLQFLIPKESGRAILDRSTVLPKEFESQNLVAFPIGLEHVLALSFGPQAAESAKGSLVNAEATCYKRGTDQWNQTSSFHSNIGLLISSSGETVLVVNNSNNGTIRSVTDPAVSKASDLGSLIDVATADKGNVPEWAVLANMAPQSLSLSPLTDDLDYVIFSKFNPKEILLFKDHLRHQVRDFGSFYLAAIWSNGMDPVFLFEQQKNGMLNVALVSLSGSLIGRWDNLKLPDSKRPSLPKYAYDRKAGSIMQYWMNAYSSENDGPPVMARLMCIGTSKPIELAIPIRDAFDVDAESRFRLKQIR